MSRLRITFTTAALVLALAALTLNSLAQPPGRGGGGGGGGRGGRGGGPGGGPGGGFGGPGGNTPLQLASNPAVQTDMKVTEKQKVQIKSLSDKFNAKMQEFFGQMGGPGGRGQGGAGPQGKGQGRGRNGNGNGQNGQGGLGDDQGQVVPDAQGGNGGFGGGGNGGGGGGGRGNRGNRNQNGQQIPEDPEVAQQRAEQRQMMRDAMTELRQSAETSLARILDKGQVARLKQIQLQLEGPGVVLREDMMEKLGIDEAQVVMMREIMNENRTLQRETRRSRGDIMKTAFARINPNQGNNGQNGGDNANVGNGQNGGNNGRGRGGRGNFDPEAMRKVMEEPQIKAQMDQIQSQEQKLSTQLAAAVNKTLTPRQRTMFKKMLGPPFDQSQMGRGGPWGGRGGAGPGNAATTKGAVATKGAAAAKATTSDDDDDETPKAAATTAAPAKKSKAAAPKRKSLREQRGAAPSDDN
jgi:hypothetical protein